MSGKEAQRLKKLKAIDLAPWATSFWVVHRKPAQPPPDAQMVILGRAEGLKGAELAAFADLNASQLATVQRLISRRLAGYRRDA